MIIIWAGVAFRNQVWVVNGVTSLLEALAFAFCDDGDSLLVPAPFYNGFTMDLSLR